MKIAEDNETPVKHDAGKPRFDLVPPGPMLEIARAFTVGATEYGERNYLKGDGMPVDRLVAALHRHINAYQRGERMDPKSGLHPLAHAIANLMIIMEIEEKKQL